VTAPAACTHRFQVEAPYPGCVTLAGICRDCGAHRDFDPYTNEHDWNDMRRKANVRGGFRGGRKKKAL